MTALEDALAALQALTDQPPKKADLSDLIPQALGLPHFTTNKTNLKQLQIACIMDPFTLTCYAPECHLIELTPQNFRSELAAKPDLFFLESAWRGKDGLWQEKVNHQDPDLLAILALCKEQHIPTVFWNKEDPVHLCLFLPLADLCDFIFTTDADCIPAYQKYCSHNRVYHLHFAAQPRIHNPIESYVREDSFCFAGAYYHDFAARSRCFDAFCDLFIKQNRLVIYDRNLLHPTEEGAFPARYRPFIKGYLNPNEIDKAYKGYYYGINMNTVQTSSTMFARRVFELLASNTIVVGNAARGIDNLFGGLTISTDDAAQMEQQLAQIADSTQHTRAYRLLGLRKVLSEHLYEDRLAFVAKKVWGKSLLPALPTITVIGRAACADDRRLILQSYEQQEYPHKRLLWEDAPSACQDNYTAVFTADYEYGPFYLTDLALTTRYCHASVIGKNSYLLPDQTCVNPDAVYRDCSAIPPERSLVSTAPHSTNTCFCIDEFNLIRRSANLPI